MSTVDLSQYTIVPALTRDQQEKHWRASHLPWNRGRSWETYLAHSQRDGELPCAIDGSLVIWLLVRRDDPFGTMYAGCETYRRKSLLRRKGLSDVEEITTYAIASVVTPPEHQKKGYGRHMLRLLHYNLAIQDHLPPFPAEWGEPPALPANFQHLPRGWASILWSDVGVDFYQRCTIGAQRLGWTKCGHPTELSWKLLDVSEGEESPWTLLYEADLPQIATYLSFKRKERLLLDTSETSLVSQDPATPGLLEWIHASRALTPAQREGLPLAARLSDPAGRDSLVLFGTHLHTHDTFGKEYSSKLFITDAYDLPPDRLNSLLVLLDEVGQQAGKTHGCIWGLNPGGALAKAWSAATGRDVELHERPNLDGHILQMAWYGPEEEEHELVDGGVWMWC